MQKTRTWEKGSDSDRPSLRGPNLFGQGEKMKILPICCSTRLLRTYRCQFHVKVIQGRLYDKRTSIEKFQSVFAFFFPLEPPFSSLKADPSADEDLESSGNVVQSVSVIKMVCRLANTTSPWSLQRNWVDGRWRYVSALIPALLRCMDRKRLGAVFSKTWTTK